MLLSFQWNQSLLIISQIVNKKGIRVKCLMAKACCDEKDDDDDDDDNDVNDDDDGDDDDE